MKKIILILVVLLFGGIATAQQNDVTKFMGIPIDGTEYEMQQKLIAKGFKRIDKETLEGEFNGSQVRIILQTNKNKVWRIIVVNTGYTEGNVIRAYNRLVNQFENNERYSKFGDENYTIPEDEDISYEMISHNKRYDASFYQKPDKEYLNKTAAEAWAELEDNLRCMTYKKVWFKITEVNGRYLIVIYYENGYNEPNGEDL